MTAPLSMQVLMNSYGSYELFCIVCFFAGSCEQRVQYSVFRSMEVCCCFFGKSLSEARNLKKNEAITMAVMWGIMDPDEP